MAVSAGGRVANGPRWRLARALAIPSRRAWLETGVLWLGFVALAAPVAALAGLLPGRVALDDPLVIA